MSQTTIILAAILLLMFKEIFSFSRNIGARQSVSVTLDKIFDKKHYDARLRPNYEGKPIEVKVGFWILSIDSINVVDMEFTLDLFLRQEWIDYRLDHGLNDTISLGNTVLENIWLPDSYFLNAKKGYFHEVTSSNRMIMIAPEGLVKYNLRVTITTSCPLDLRKYPMDVQTCPLSVESYGYDEQHIRFKWEGGNGDGMRFVPNEEIRFLPQYKLQTLHLSTTTAQYVVGNFSSAVATFTFERTYNYFLTHIYGTSLVVVIISWMAFLIPREQAAARISLGITSVLTEVAILNMMNNSMPRVNYVKSIDKFLIGCFLFVFFTLIEYFLILALTMKIEKGKQKQAKAHNGKPAVKRGIQLSLNTLQDYKKTSSSTTVARNSGCAELSSTQENKCSGCNRSCWNWSTKPVLVESTVLKIEDYSLFLFPLCFSIFNAIYWAGYL